MSYSVPHRKELSQNLADLILLMTQLGRTPHRESESYVTHETGREAPWCCV